MKFAILAGSLVLSLAPGTLLAEMNYSGFEIGYVDLEVDQGFGTVSGDGFDIAGSYEMNDRFFVFGEMQDTSLDFDIDGSTYELGFGLTHDFNPDLDFVASLSYLDAELEAPGITVKDDGFALGAGIRSRVASSFEVDAGIRFIDLDQSGSDTGLLLNGRYYFNDSMALSLGTDINDNTEALRFGFRAEF